MASKRARSATIEPRRSPRKPKPKQPFQQPANPPKALSKAYKAVWAQSAGSTAPSTTAVQVPAAIKPPPLHSQRTASDYYSAALGLLPASPLLSPVTEHTADELELGNLDDLDELDAEKDVEDAILPTVETNQKETPKEASSEVAQGAKKRRKTAGAQQDEDNEDVELVERRLRGETRTPEAISDDYLTYQISWSCKLGKRILCESTESKVDQRMEFYYEKKLKTKRDRLLRNIAPTKKLSVLSTKAIVKTDGRAQNIPFMVDELEHPGPIGEEWQPVDEQLINFGERFPNKGLYIIVTWTLKEVAPAAEDCTRTTGQVALEAVDAEPVIVGNSETSNMLRAVVEKVRNEGEDGAGSIWRQISDRWRCDGRGGCPTSNVEGVCWRDSQQKHHRLMTTELMIWTEALRRKDPGVDFETPPTQLLERLIKTAAGSKSTSRTSLGEPLTGSNSPALPPVINNFYASGGSQTQTPTAMESTLTGPPSSPVFVLGKVCHDKILSAYSEWLQSRVEDPDWKLEFKAAAMLCHKKRFRLDYTRKLPIEWWEKNGVQEGIARTWMDDIRLFQREQTEGGDIQSRFSKYMAQPEAIYIPEPDQDYISQPVDRSEDSIACILTDVINNS